MKSYFAYFQPNSTWKPLEQSQNLKRDCYIARPKWHPANWTHLGILEMLA